ncbi:MAG: response regulator [Euryarchaeota archaeon]|nr:response regulator [Euryarchaeota archaeon]
MSVQPLHILLVEDEPGRATEVRRHIERHNNGHKVIATVYGKGVNDALDGMDGGPHLILLDLVAPGDHVLLTAENLRYRPESREVPIVVVGESKRWLDRVERLGLPQVEAIRRPIEPERFDSLLASV